MNNKALVNNASVSGRVYSINMAERVVENKESKVYGTKFLSGTISVATDEDCLNIVEIHFSYVPETRNGSTNLAYSNLSKIINENKTVEAVGKDEAQLVRVPCSFESNDFYSAKSDEIVESVRISSGYVALIDKIPTNNNFFNVAFLFDKYTIPEDEDQDVKVRGAVFSFRGELIPVVLTFKHSDVSYWDGLANDGYKHLIKVTGHFDMCNIEMQQETEGVFGPIVRTITRRKRDYVIDNVELDELVIGTADEGGLISMDEIKQAVQDRQVHLASVKTDYGAYQAKKNAQQPATSMTPAAAGINTADFGF